MKHSSNTYVYFALNGDEFDPDIITQKLGIEPTSSNKKGDQGTYNPALGYSSWKYSTQRNQEYLEVDRLVDEIVNLFYNKIEIINQLKTELNLHSVLQIVLDIDINPEISTPSLGYHLKTIEFLYTTKTETDVDLYKFDSREIASKIIDSKE
jgi:hypothetical protein